MRLLIGVLRQCAKGPVDEKAVDEVVAVWQYWHVAIVEDVIAQRMVHGKMLEYGRGAPIFPCRDLKWHHIEEPLLGIDLPLPDGVVRAVATAAAGSGVHTLELGFHPYSSVQRYLDGCRVHRASQSLRCTVQAWQRHVERCEAQALDQAVRDFVQILQRMCQGTLSPEARATYGALQLQVVQGLQCEYRLRGLPQRQGNAELPVPGCAALVAIDGRTLIVDAGAQQAPEDAVCNLLCALWEAAKALPQTDLKSLKKDFKLLLRGINDLDDDDLRRRYPPLPPADRWLAAPAQPSASVPRPLPVTRAVEGRTASGEAQVPSLAQMEADLAKASSTAPAASPAVPPPEASPAVEPPPVLPLPEATHWSTATGHQPVPPPRRSHSPACRTGAVEVARVGVTERLREALPEVRGRGVTRSPRAPPRSRSCPETEADTQHAVQQMRYTGLHEHLCWLHASLGPLKDRTGHSAQLPGRPQGSARPHGGGCPQRSLSDGSTACDAAGAGASANAAAGAAAGARARSGSGTAAGADGDGVDAGAWDEQSIGVQSIKLESTGAAGLELGRAGEQMVFQWLCAEHGSAHVTWQNMRVEQGLPYDLTVHLPDGRLWYVEVKTSQYDVRQFHRQGSADIVPFSREECRWMLEHEGQYRLYRVYRAGPDWRCYALRDMDRAFRSERLRLHLSFMDPGAAEDGEVRSVAGVFNGGVGGGVGTPSGALVPAPAKKLASGLEMFFKRYPSFRPA